MRGIDLKKCSVEAIGLAGDRRWMVVDAQGKFITQRTCPSLAKVTVAETGDGIQFSHVDGETLDVAMPGPDGRVLDVTVWGDDVEAVDTGEVVSTALSQMLGEPVQLVFMADKKTRLIEEDFGDGPQHVSFADGFPLLLTNSASLDDLNQRVDEPVEMKRFRPNVVVNGGQAWEEDCWRRIAIGSVEFLVASPCRRCVVTTLDPLSGDKLHPSEPLATLGKFHRDSRGGIIFGQNLIPLNFGEISQDDSVTVLETGASNLHSGTAQKQAF